MYNFTKQEELITKEAKSYGVKIERKDGKFRFSNDFHGSSSVERYLVKIMATYNKHVEQGF